MQYHLTEDAALKGTLAAECYEAVSQSGEDSTALHFAERCVFLCVADGCGGLGSRRYEQLNGHTGAYEASRLAVQVMEQYKQIDIPCSLDEERNLQKKLEETLETSFGAFANEHGMLDQGRITGTMQRCLPTTLCAVWANEDYACVSWAGDSRAYVLDEKGLHQCTADHLKGSPDALCSLFHDVPLSRLVSADRPVRLDMCRVKLEPPCAVLAVTDGAYSALPSPMAFEKLLLDALCQSENAEEWKDRLIEQICHIAQDDASVALWIPGAFCDFRQTMDQRCKTLEQENCVSCTEHWEAFRANYDWTEGDAGGRVDWRI